MIYHKIIIPFLIAVQFMTTIPIKLPYLPSREQNALSMLFYPVIGLMIGGILWLMATFIHLPIMLLSCLIMVVWVGLTGGLHLDGLADTADAWVGGFGDRERTLTIMKDPNTGAMGVIAIVLCLALKWASIYSLLDLNFSLALLFIPMLGRLSVLLLFATTPYIRQNGLGSALREMNKIPMIFIILLSSTLLFNLSWVIAITSFIIFLITTFYLRCCMLKRIQGMTGDTLGASIELVEITQLLTIISIIYSTTIR